MTQHISSEKARANWRELLDSVAAGEEIVIERYGQPVAVLSPVGDKAAVREPAPTYNIDREQLKAEIVAEVLEELGAAPPQPEYSTFGEAFAALRASIAADGGLGFEGMTTDEIVEHMRKTRREVYEELYGDQYDHLY